MNNTTIRFEFIALMATIMSIGAMATDTLLPALGVIGDAFGIHETSHKQLLIIMTFLGAGVGQLFVGALSDSIGRKPVIYIGFSIFVVASLLSVMTTSYEVLVLSRIVQGIGISAPRTLCNAIIRDSYSGDQMARVMSFVSMVFIFVPAIAPMLGSAILYYAGWEAIFYTQAILALLGGLWFAARQEETLSKEKRVKLSTKLYIAGLKTFFATKSSLYYTVAMGFALGGFMTFLSTVESILIVQYQQFEMFPYLFGSIALSMGTSMFINGKTVVKYGAKKMVSIAAIFFTVVPFVYIIVFMSNNPDIYILMAFLMVQIFTIGFIFGNLTSLTMGPLGHIAGMASAINGVLSMIMAVIIAAIVGQFIHAVAAPLFVGFFIDGLCLLFFLKKAKSV